MMNSKLLPGLKILVVEDEYVIARELSEALERHGAKVLGPVATLDAAMAQLSANEDLAGAVLDIKLHGSQAYTLAEMLRGRGVPFLFATGYDRQEIAPDFRDVPHCEKPVDVRTIIATLAREMERRTLSSQE
ncbi:response regulator [Sabulicella rubraurantiaca]|uniref:response regulator n=1 Tax=Sabulicella rubraurantiaca TaxID=2811429 RepID=UPI001A95D06B|nr:response regulator [Sabulicella rubraurantiaca]